MDLTHWLAFVGVALFVTFTPGPGVLLAISNSLSHGPARAMVSSIGNAAGLLVVSSAATAGLGVLLHTSATAFLMLKLLGACYLIYLGVKQWRQAARPLAADRATPTHAGQGSAPGDEAAGRPLASNWRLFGHGLTVALTNPKAILFFTALFPQFMTDPAHAMREFFILTLTFAACAVLAHACYVLLAGGLRRRLSAPGTALWLNRGFGACFVALGVSLLGLRSRTA